MRKPYIGICDFTSREQSERILRNMPPNFSHELMVGVMMSRKTLCGFPTKWADVFPEKESIAKIFSDDIRAMNTIHYADYDVGDVRDRNLAETLWRVQSYGGRYLDAIQLDMIWPDASELKSFREFLNIPIVLQVGKDAMRECADDPLMVCDRLAEYGDAIDYVLFDKSMGKGMGMDTTLLATFVDALAARIPRLMPAVAGGLGPHTMHLVEPLTRHNKRISMDMQGQMRSSGDAMLPIEWDRAEAAFRAAIALFPQ